MKKILLFLFLVLASCSLKAQYANNIIVANDVISYYTNGTPTNGLKIKTNLPFTNGTHMPTIMIEGFAFGPQETIDLKISYYIYNDRIYSGNISTSGVYAPPISIANENGKVVFFINDKPYGPRFHIRAFSMGQSQDLAANYTGWSVVDSALLSTAATVTQLPYVNKFAGKVVMPDSVKVGVGTLTPRAVLDVASTTNDTTISVLGRLAAGNGTGDGTYLGVRNYNNANNGPMFGLVHKYTGVLNSAILFHRGTATTGGFITFQTNNGKEQMRLDANGNLGLGTTATSTYKLAVNGTIGAKKLQITQTGWADFVFQQDYALPSLQEVKAYIDVHQHLPGVPSAAEVAEKGVDVGEMNKILLQKVEELTLYLMEQQKRIEELEKKVK
jgi:hypothetical protein